MSVVAAQIQCIHPVVIPRARRAAQEQATFTLKWPSIDIFYPTEAQALPCAGPSLCIERVWRSRDLAGVQDYPTSPGRGIVNLAQKKQRETSEEGVIRC